MAENKTMKPPAGSVLTPDLYVTRSTPINFGGRIIDLFPRRFFVPFPAEWFSSFSKCSLWEQVRLHDVFVAARDRKEYFQRLTKKIL